MSPGALPSASSSSLKLLPELGQRPQGTQSVLWVRAAAERPLPAPQRPACLQQPGLTGSENAGLQEAPFHRPQTTVSPSPMLALKISERFLVSWSSQA